MHRRRLPVLEPCKEVFENMPGDAKARHCARCEKSVYNVSGMTEPEAEQFLESRRGQSICVRYRADAQGRVRFRGSTPIRAALVAAVSVCLAACAGHGQEEDLVVPSEGIQCRDAHGFEVPCDDASVIPDADPASVAEITEVGDLVEGGVEGGVVGGVEGGVVGQMIATEVVPSPGETSIVEGTATIAEDATGCPIRPNRSSQEDVLVGLVAAPTTRKAQRREARIRRRAARRARRKSAGS